jgi:uncharacterized protein YdhG (YjbR/CyaY superfamily)
MTTRDDAVDAYIAGFPAPTQRVLEKVRRVIHTAVPGAHETSSYDIPAITLDGRPVVYFAGWKRHVSIYPVPSGDADYEARVAPHRSGASTAKFSLAKSVPYELVGEIARLLADEHRERRSRVQDGAFGRAGLGPLGP